MEERVKSQCHATTCFPGVTVKSFQARVEEFICKSIPWVSLGRSDKGVDCLGLIIAVYASFGIEVDDPMSLDPSRVREFVLADQWVEALTIRTGDVASYTVKGVEQHLGILIPGGILHATEDLGVLVTKRSIMKLTGYFSFKDFFSC